MSGIRLGSNIAALQALRHFGRSTLELSRVNERLSSGLRINRASDDAAGLAIADSLRADQRVYGQGLRNINDGISLLNTAEGALSSATDIGIRIRELATQSANGTMANSQRRALNNEANRLVDEFNRLTATVNFNGRSLLVANFGTLTIQNGYGSNGGVSVQLNAQLSRTIGTGSFGAAVNSATSSNSVQNVVTADLNNDGKLDVVAQMNLGTNVGVMLGNGDGTFGAMTNLSVGLNPSDVVLADIDGDGRIDIAASSSTGQNVSVFRGNGNGTFQAGVSTAVGAAVVGLAASDFNGDGKSDLMVQTTTNFRTYLSSSGGNFQAPTTLTTSSTAAFDSGMQLGDFTGDGVTDLLATMGGSARIELFSGAGNGQFTLTSSMPTGTIAVRDVVAADFDGDNDLDFASAYPNGGGGTIGIWTNNGTGSFTNISQLSTPPTNVANLTTADVNNDGIPDILATDFTSSDMQVHIGRGDGSFDAAVTTTLGGNSLPPNVADVNGDGVIDSLTGGTGLNVRLGSTTSTTMLPRLNLMSASSARETFSVIDSFLDRTKREFGAIGAFRSRLETAYNAQTVQRNEFGAAESRLRDADIAEDSAQLTRLNILQQAGVQILSLANIQPQIALKLLTGR